MRKNNKLKISKETEKRIISLYCLKLLSSKKISKKFKISKTSLYNILKRNNIKPRTISESGTKYFCDNEFFKDINTEKKAYFLGWMYSDGNIIRRNKTEIVGFEIGLSGKDEFHILKKFKNSIKFTGNIHRKKKYKKTHKLHRRISIKCKDSANYLIEKGCFPAKSLILKFPTDNQVPEFLLNHFLRGFIEGDGCISFTKNKTLLIGFLSSKDFSLGFKNYIEKKLNIYVGLYNYKSHRNSTEIKIYGLDGIKFLDYIYNNSSINLKRKRLVYENYLKYLKKRLSNKDGFACLDQVYVKKLCEYMGYKYDNGYQFTVSEEIRNNICNDYKNGLGLRRLQIKYNISSSQIRRILLLSGIHKNPNSKTCKNILKINNRIRNKLNNLV